jgi:acyl carrier protein
VLLDADAEFVVNEHSVGGIPTLVGTAYLEMLDELGRLKRPHGATVVARLSFSSPLMLPAAAPRRLRLFVDADGDRLRFSFRSQAVAGPAIWHEHCAGELDLAGAVAPAQSDLAAIRGRCDGVDENGMWFLRSQGEDTGFLSFGERWNCLRRVHTGAGEWLVRVELPERFAGDTDRHRFHPALVDVAFAAAVRFAHGRECLPVSYEGVTFRRPCPAAAWCYARLLLAEPESDLLSFALVLLDDDGHEIASAARYSLRRVSELSGRAGAPAASSEDILPAEGIDALTRMLSVPTQPHVIVSTSDLDAQIAKAAPKGRGDEHDADPAGAALAAYARPELATTYEEPSNEIEQTISEIWQAILGIAPIGVNDHFIELGGNSLLAVQAAASTSDAYQLELTAEAFMRNPTVRGVAETVVELLISLAGEETLEELLSGLESAG